MNNTFTFKSLKTILETDNINDVLEVQQRWGTKAENIYLSADIIFENHQINFFVDDEGRFNKVRINFKMSPGYTHEPCFSKVLEYHDFQRIKNLNYDREEMSPIDALAEIFRTMENEDA